MATRSEKRTYLLNGCYITRFSVTPSNWKDAGASIKKDWYITYRFYDPKFRETPLNNNGQPKYKNGKSIMVKGMNEYHTLMARRQMTEAIMKDEMERLSIKHWNPITNTFMTDESITEDIVIPIIPTLIPRDTPFIPAMWKAWEKKECDDDVKTDLKSVLKYTAEAASQLRYDQIPVKDLQRVHMLVIFEQLAKNKGKKWTNNNHNHYRSYLSMLFEVLVLWSAMDINPVEKIPTKKHAAAKRKPLTPEQRIAIDRDLRSNNYRFWLLMNIFYLAGCRRTEIVRIKARDVHLKEQYFVAERRKGKNYVMVEYTISDLAVPLWEQALISAEPEDYVFAKGLKPASIPINARQITRRWRYWVKNKKDDKGNPKYGTDVPDWYTLKHMQTTEISRRFGTKVAAAFNNESERMVRERYDLEHDQRERERKKKEVKVFVDR